MAVAMGWRHMIGSRAWRWALAVTLLIWPQPPLAWWGRTSIGETAPNAAGVSQLPEALLVSTRSTDGHAPERAARVIPEDRPLARAEVVINIPAFTLYLYDGGNLVRTYPIAVGNVVSPSHLGRTTVVNKVRYPTYYPPDWYQRHLAPIPPGPDNPVGVRWLGLGFPGYGIHGNNDPSSIGKAVSAGCVRMNNDDVVELASLIDVGTPVTFLYEPILARRDPVIGMGAIQVFPDIYGLGGVHVAAATAKLRQVGVLEPLNEQVLSGLLAEASGRWEFVPVQQEVQWKGRPLPGAFRAGFDVMVPLSVIANDLGLSYKVETDGSITVDGRPLNRARRLGGVVYAEVGNVAEALGLRLKQDNGGLSLSPVLVRSGAQSSVRGFLDRGQVLAPVSHLAAEHGMAIQWDSQAQSTWIQGKPVFGSRFVAGTPYLPLDLIFKLTGVRYQVVDHETPQ